MLITSFWLPAPDKYRSNIFCDDQFNLNELTDMLRSLLVLILIVVGSYFALQEAFYSLLFYVANAYFRPEEWVWSGWVGSLHLSLVAGIYVVCSTLFTRQKLIWSGRITVLGLFLLQGFLSTLSTEHFDYCWAYWVEFFKVMVVVYCMIVLVTDFTKFRLVVLIMVLALGVEQSKQGWFYLMTSPGLPNSNLVLFLGDNNGTAVGMLMLTPLMGLLAQTTQNRRAKSFYYFLFIGCLYRALSTYSRGGFLATIAMGAVWWFQSQRKLKGLVALIVILGLVLPALPSAFWNRIRTLQTYEEEQDNSALGRLYFWEVAVKMANAHPLTGVGFSGYNAAYNDYDLSDGQYGTGRSVHSVYYGILAELGYVGLCLYVVILLNAFRTCNQVRRIALGNPALSDFGKSAIALKSSLTAFVVGGSFVPLQYNEMFWHWVGLSIVLGRLALQYKEHPLSAEELVGQSPARLQNPLAA
jgi:putative inorganic carbon (HCO3(-)) transporter